MGSICFFQGQMPKGNGPLYPNTPKKGRTTVVIGNTTKDCFIAASSVIHAASALEGA